MLARRDWDTSRCYPWLDADPVAEETAARQSLWSPATMLRQPDDSQSRPNRRGAAVVTAVTEAAE